MTDNVVGIFGDKVAKLGEPNPVLIEIFRDLLARAESGELQSFIGAGFLSSGLRISVWGPPHQDVYQMMGSLAWLQHEYHTRVKETGEPA